MNNLLVSVWMITYNHEKYISEAIESVLMQKTDFDYEIIIGEDCSTDNTKAILKEYEKKYPHLIKVIYQDHNVGAMRNAFEFTFPRCHGKYIACLEGDDFWIDPLKLQKQVDFLEQHTEYVLSFHNVLSVNVIDDKRTKREFEMEVFSKKPEEIPVGHPSHTSSMVFRNVIRIFPTDIDKLISGDSYLQFVLARFGKSTFQRDIYPNIHRRHPQSIWSYKTQEYKIEQGIILYEKLLEIAISKEELVYLNRLLIKNRILYFLFLFNNHKKKKSLTYFKETLIAAWSNKLLMFFILFNLIQLPPLSGIYKYFKRTE